MTTGDQSDERLGTAEHGMIEELEVNRPVPTAGFRGTLGRHLAARDAGYGPRPERLRLIVLVYLTTGALLLVIAVLEAAGML
jgi:hypothetical protein